MNDVIEKMARDFFGYGRWDAPYWFIGPEPAGGDHVQRAAAFRSLGKEGLCDCKEFHEAIHVDWSSKLQKTWKRLMLLLKSFLSEDGKEEFSDKGNLARTLLNYQWGRWGSKTGNTCVIELRGLNTKESSEYREICDAELDRRIARINERLEASKDRLKLVVMYGKNERERDRWKQIAEFAGFPLILDQPVKHDSTISVFAYHPNARGREGDYWLKDSYWEDLGKMAREALSEP
jgi:hypothetical protein